jgi:hypothetical protein
VATPYPKVIYLAGFGRSGSTILGRTLGEIEGWFHCGEPHKASHDRVCGCGAPLFDCDLWGPIFREMGERYLDLGPEPFIEMQRTSLGESLGSLATIARERRRRSENGVRLRRYVEMLVDLHREAGHASRAHVMIDSSKAVTGSYLLASLADTDLYVLHLVRDPRATAYSWSRKTIVVKRGKTQADRWEKRAWSSSYHWLRRNGLIEVLVRRRLPADRYMRVRYEDFVERPRATVHAICSFAGEPDARSPFVGERTVRLQPSHAIVGNPRVRSLAGRLELRLDNEWETGMKARARLLATLAAAPLLQRYGYPMFPRTEREQRGST